MHQCPCLGMSFDFNIDRQASNAQVLEELPAGPGTLPMAANLLQSPVQTGAAAQPGPSLVVGSAASPFGQAPVQQQAQEAHLKALASSSHRAPSDGLGAPKSSGDVWDHNRPLESPFSSHAAAEFPTKPAALTADEGLGEEEPQRYSRDDIAAMAAETGQQGNSAIAASAAASVGAGRNDRQHDSFSQQAISLI